MESQIHINLVKVILNYAKKYIPQENYDFIECDSSGENSSVRLIENVIPDFYYSFNDVLIIGEAKTRNDFDTKHSLNQYKCYLRECEIFNGRRIIILAVPWDLMVTAKNYFRKMKKISDLEIEIVIINEYGKAFVI